MERIINGLINLEITLAIAPELCDNCHAFTIRKPIKANPPQGGDAKSWVPLGRDRQTAEVISLRQFLFAAKRRRL
jgi:hypothetical protein